MSEVTPGYRLRPVIVEVGRPGDKTDGSGGPDDPHADPGRDVAPQPTLADIDRLVAETRRLGVTVDVELDLDGAGAGSALEPSVEVSAYRIIQEALTNVRKHAGAHRVAVRLGLDKRCLRLRIADDGIGAKGADGTGHGLAGIRERAEVYGGTVTTASPTGGGFVLEVELPVAGS